MKRRPYFVFDFPPGQLANHELHQHVEEGPQVVVATHFLQDTRGGARREKVAEAERVGVAPSACALTLFLWALMEA